MKTTRCYHYGTQCLTLAVTYIRVGSWVFSELTVFYKSDLLIWIKTTTIFHTCCQKGSCSNFKI